MDECYKESKKHISRFGLNRHVCTPLAKLPMECQLRTGNSFQKLDKYFVASCICTHYFFTKLRFVIKGFKT